MPPIDLHAHTIHSDGTLTPTALVRLARAAGLELLAVTDHDTTAGLAEARAEGRALGVEIVAGCEVSTRIPEGNVHVLGLGFDDREAGLQRFLEGVREARARRNVRMYERLAKLGMPLRPEQVERHALGGVVARPHFARAMVEAGYVPDLRAAFNQVLKDGGPGYVEVEAPAPREAIRALSAAGGVAVIAHPGQIQLAGRVAYDRFLAPLAAEGLAGIEVFHPSHDAEQRALFLSLARAHDLVASGGSDFHGDNKPRIRLGVGDGTIQIDRATWDALARRRRAA